jgi:hypothetical protein
MSYLERLKNRKPLDSELTQLTEGAKMELNGTCVSSVSTSHGRFQKNAVNDAEPIFHGFTLADLQAEAHPDEWLDIRDNPKALAAFALALLEDRQIQAGIRPERFTRPVYCPGCGVVYLPQSWPSSGHYEPLEIPQVNGCRWCANRLEGRPYPKAYPLPPNGFDSRQEGRWPFSPDCRPLVWQGSAERKGADNA